MELNVLVWNIMIPVLPPLRFYGQYERAERIPKIIQGLENLDVIVFNELIPPTIHEYLKSQLYDIGFKYSTNRINDLLTESGGICVFSKYPILHEDFMLFGSDCAISDCLSSKGVVFAKINKDGLLINIFATHFQSGDKYHNIRESQTQTTKNFILAQSIQPQEALLFCGDLNTGRFLNNAEIQHILFTLNMIIPIVHESSHPFTFDAVINPLVGMDDPSQYRSKKWPNGCSDYYYKEKQCICCDSEWLDYTFISKNHLQPKLSWMKSIVAKTDLFTMSFTALDKIETEFLSDHFPVLGHFEFETITGLTMHEKLNQASNHNPNTAQSTLFIFLIIVLILLILIVFVIFVMRFKKKQVFKKTLHK
jgi:endonuclease/exonuclease/phosphatase family metal-dependent hydrolase